MAPLVFTKLLKLVAAFLRKQGIRFVLYRNDMLTIGSKYQETALFTQVAIDLLTALSFNVHKEKSTTIPTQVIAFLSFIVKPPEKVKRTRTLCQQILTAEGVFLRTLAQLLGVLESHRPAVLRAPLHLRQLQAQLNPGFTKK